MSLIVYIPKILNRETVITYAKSILQSKPTSMSNADVILIVKIPDISFFFYFLISIHSII